MLPATASETASDAEMVIIGGNGVLFMAYLCTGVYKSIR
jgi:hypothetical protein